MKTEQLTIEGYQTQLSDQSDKLPEELPGESFPDYMDRYTEWRNSLRETEGVKSSLVDESLAIKR